MTVIIFSRFYDTKKSNLQKRVVLTRPNCEIRKGEIRRAFAQGVSDHQQSSLWTSNLTGLGFQIRNTSKTIHNQEDWEHFRKQDRHQ